jgi:YVTN family beta-propeller protein
LRRTLIACLLVLGDGGQIAVSAPAPLILEAKIPLGRVEGRLDHLAVDIGRRRLYVAELGNNSVGVVDIEARRVINTIGGFAQQQGIAYEKSTDTVYISNGSDGSIKLFRGASLDPIGSIALGSDADNMQAAPATGRLIVGYGNGALGVIDPRRRNKIADITLSAHPEGFRLTGDARRYIRRHQTPPTLCRLWRGSN